MCEPSQVIRTAAAGLGDTSAVTGLKTCRFRDVFAAQRQTARPHQEGILTFAAKRGKRLLCCLVIYTRQLELLYFSARFACCTRRFLVLFCIQSRKRLNKEVGVAEKHIDGNVTKKGSRCDSSQDVSSHLTIIFYVTLTRVDYSPSGDGTDVLCREHNSLLSPLQCPKAASVEEINIGS